MKNPIAWQTLQSNLTKSNLWCCQIGCYDWDEDDDNDLIGCVDITLRSLIDSKESGVCTYSLLIFLLLFCLHLVATDWLLWLRRWWKPWFYWLNQCLCAAIDRDKTIWGKVNVLGYMYRCNIKQKLWNMQHRFWLVLTYDLLEDRRILDNVTMSNTLPPHFIK